jgi:hypothetical protein
MICDDAGRQSGRFLDGITIRKRFHSSLGHLTSPQPSLKTDGSDSGR